jgi:CheY-like chemotaxis protein
VDDEPTLVELGRRMLQPLGYDVVTQTDSVAALALFREHPEQFDLVVSDMTMPHMTGDVLSREMRKIRSDIPIIICTGYSRHMDSEKAEALGINALAKKPYEIGEMTRTIRKVLDGEA